jgi:predicted aldo/keto reductase-like oxidoreductase
MFDAWQHARYAHANRRPEAKRGDRCLACGECETKCPQHIAIIDWLERADRFLAAAAG